MCEGRTLKVAIGDQLLAYNGSKAACGPVENGERLTVAGWSERGNPVASDGREIEDEGKKHAIDKDSKL